jgi:hypothetical protein
MMRSFALEAEVQRLLREERYDLAVLVSQTLLELRVEAELVEFFKNTGEQAIGEAALGLLPSYNLGNGRVQTFFERLVAVRLREDHGEVMAALRAHVERRNRIAHRGEQVSRDDASASLAAVLAVSQLVHELSYRALGLDDLLEEEARQEREMLGEDEENDWR